MSLVGLTRPLSDVGSMSGLSPESRPERSVKARPTRAITGLMHRSKTYRFDPVVPMAPTIRRTGRYGISCPIRGSVRLDACELDHLGPLLGFLGDQFPKISGRPGNHCRAQVGAPRLDLGIG